MRGRVLNGRSGLSARVRGAARLACAAAILGGLAAPAQAAPGDIFTFAGTGAAGFGGDGGPATSASLSAPIAVAWLGDGSALVADYANHRIRRITPGGQITTLAGTGSAGYSGDGGPATSAQLSWPLDVEPTADGGFLIADLGNKRVRKVSPAGIITTVAGTGQGGSQGDGGPAASARVSQPASRSPPMGDSSSRTPARSGSGGCPPTGRSRGPRATVTRVELGTVGRPSRRS